MDLVDGEQERFLACEEDEGDVAHEDDAEDDLADVGLPEALLWRIDLLGIAEVE